MDLELFMYLLNLCEYYIRIRCSVSVPLIEGRLLEVRFDKGALNTEAPFGSVQDAPPRAPECRRSAGCLAMAVNGAVNGRSVVDTMRKPQVCLPQGVAGRRPDACQVVICVAQWKYSGDRNSTP